MNDEQKKKIVELRLNGQSYSKIASKLGVSVSTIKSYCVRNNVFAFNSEDETRNTMNSKKGKENECGFCGKFLTRSRIGQHKKFCSEECRRNWWKSNNNKINRKAWYISNCAGCGIEFKSYGNKNRKYCSHACYIKKRFQKEGDTDDSRATDA